LFEVVDYRLVGQNSAGRAYRDTQHIARRHPTIQLSTNELSREHRRDLRPPNFVERAKRILIEITGFFT
jgi:hypothetical protein